MREISLHLLDLIENSLTAGASLVEVSIEEDPPPVDRMTITIRDNGAGMPPELLAQAADPFANNRSARRMGLGLALMRANAMAWGGDLALESRLGAGTTLRVWFRLGHLDRPPLGDWATTLAGLILSRPEVEFRYVHRVGRDEFEFDTRQLRQELGQAHLTDPAVIALLRQQVHQSLLALGADRTGPTIPPATAS